jgi:CRISPR-associated protein (TIGR03984 family)
MSYQRKIKTKPAISQPVKTFTGIEDLKVWLEAQAKAHQMMAPCYLLAHANDGVIWGRLDETGSLLTSHDALYKTKASDKWDVSRIKTATASLPLLQIETLQQARLFNDQTELYMWRDGDGKTWHGRLIANVTTEETNDWSESFDEPQLLWGTHGTHLADGFTLLEDGAQGLYHAVPVKLTLDDDNNGELKKSPQLLVRHYLSREGAAQVAASRLVAWNEE